jgi:DNA integrity scanning protein DisA with diadenylate cyclase activity
MYILQGYTKENLKIIIETVSNYSKSIQNILLASIDILEPPEIISICDKILQMNIKNMENEKNVNQSFESMKFFILLTMKTLLLSVDLNDVIEKFNTNSLSEYRCWLFFDALITRTVIYENLGNYCVCTYIDMYVHIREFLYVYI